MQKGSAGTLGRGLKACPAEGSGAAADAMLPSGVPDLAAQISNVLLMETWMKMVCEEDYLLPVYNLLVPNIRLAS